MKNTVLLLILFSFCNAVQAQDTLPKFSLRNVGSERIVIGWVNAYPIVKQISIQRSFDSVNFKTILSVADPAAVQNGYVDAKAPNDHMYYRLFIMLDSGRYLFSSTKRPILDTANAQTVELPDAGQPSVKNGNNPPPNVTKVPDYVPSVYVYTNKDGYLFINLPDAEQKKYHIKFYEETGSLLFELKNIKEQALTLDKANFLHAGWFRFELFNDEKLVEKNKFFLARDF